jgi:hypothetical protein
MKKLDLGQSIQILANIGVIAGIAFLAVQIRTNTATNRIAMYQASSENWMQLNGELATDVGLNELLEKAFSGQTLDSIEYRRFGAWVNQQLTHAAFVRRLFEAGLFSEVEFRLEFGSIRALAEVPAVRQFIETIPTGGFRDLILADYEQFGRLLKNPGALDVEFQP